MSPSCVQIRLRSMAAISARLRKHCGFERPNRVVAASKVVCARSASVCGGTTRMGHGGCLWAYGREPVHYRAPGARKIARQIGAFLKWLGGDAAIDPVLKAGIAHLWFVSIHPFEDGNGRIARAIADMVLARAENTSQRFYSCRHKHATQRAFYAPIGSKTTKASGHSFCQRSYPTLSSAPRIAKAATLLLAPRATIGSRPSSIPCI